MNRSISNENLFLNNSMHIKLAIFFYPKRIRIPVVIKYNAVNKTDTMSNTQTKTKKMHVASVTLTNNNESNEKQMLKKKMVRFKPYERTS